MVIEKLLVVVLKIIKDFFLKKIPELIPSALDYGWEYWFLDGKPILSLLRYKTDPLVSKNWSAIHIKKTCP